MPREIITIEEDRLFDPVEGARTRARTAHAYIQDWQKVSCDSAKTLLIEGLNRIEKLETVRRTKLVGWLHGSRLCLCLVCSCRSLPLRFVVGELSPTPVCLHRSNGTRVVGEVLRALLRIQASLTLNTRRR